MQAPEDKWALVTGSAKRLGKAIAMMLHTRGYKLLLHYNTSTNEAKALCASFNAQRPDSAVLMQADLSSKTAVQSIYDSCRETCSQLDVLVNNASVFCSEASDPDPNSLWQKNMCVNAELAYTLSRQLTPMLKKTKGNIVNMVDIYAERPLAGHTAYSASKAANAMLVKSLAFELAPDIRVNGISPGAILWPDSDGEPVSESYKQALLNKIPMRRLGGSENITQTLAFLLDCDYITGQILNIDGGRSVTL